MAVYRSTGSGWDLIEPGNIKASNGATWNIVKKGYRSTGSGWDEVYVGNDPRTYYFVNTQSRGAKANFWLNDHYATVGQYIEYEYSGRYNINHGGWQWFGVIDFDTADIGRKLAERPVVKSAEINMQRWDSEGFGAGYGHLFFGRYHNSISATANHWSCDFSHNVGMHWDQSPGNNPQSVSYSDGYLNRNEFIVGSPQYNGPGFSNSTWPLLWKSLGSKKQVFVDHLAGGRPLCIAATTSNGTEAGNGYTTRGLGNWDTSVTWDQKANFWRFWHAGRIDPAYGLGYRCPVLKIVLDYA